MPFPDLPPERIPGSPGHLNDHQLIDQALDYIQQAGYRDDPNFPPLPDIPVLGQSGHVTAHDRILAVLEYVKANPPGMTWATVSNTPTGTYKGSDGHTYAYYEFTTSGTLTVTTAGYVEILCVGAGGTGASYIGTGGEVRNGLFMVSAKSHNVTVGRHTGWQGDPGSTSVAGVVAYGGVGNAAGATYVGARGHASNITGTNVTYAQTGSSSPTPHSGDGGNLSVNGADGIAVVKTRLN